MGEPRTPTCLRGNPKVCPEDECPSRYLCTVKAELDAGGRPYYRVIEQAIARAENEYGKWEANA